MPITYQISTEKIQLFHSLPSPPVPPTTTGGREKGKELDNWWVIGFTYTRRTKSINKIDIIVIFFFLFL